ncbi:prepilin-type N-terminal cleavage/methylation domain-containing protein [Microseira sp. BLCC-F43]|uniref:prepilin-type N-terminal cleavage/methylation domain-containing protein n=1 Tax=Microseira sp. BLCC-F43 TaxID=3153602 RepID=UPI0035B703CC
MLTEKTRFLTKQANTRKLEAGCTGLAQKPPESPNIPQKTRFMPKRTLKNPSEQGLTLLECLVAIGVVAVVVTAFTPQIFLAVATQVQNRRAEQALQLAQGEVDRVRRTVERGDYNDTELPPAGENNIRQQPAPSSAQALPANQLYSSSPSQGVPVDVNGDGSNDFIVQTFRNPGITRVNRTVAFDFGVRVYTFTSNMGSFENPPQKAASLQLTTAAGQQQRRPLAMIYTSVAQSDNRNSLCQQRKSTGESDNNPGCQ